MAAEPLLTIDEVAAWMRCSRNTVYRRIAKRQIRTVDIGDGRAKTRIPESALAEYAARLSRNNTRRAAA